VAGALVGHDKINDFSLRSILVAALGAILLLLVLQAVGGAQPRPSSPSPAALSAARQSRAPGTTGGRDAVECSRRL